MVREERVDSYVRFGEIAGTYGLQYNRTDFKDRYPADRYRLDLVLEILKKLKPTSLLDIGCGTGDPLCEVLRLGIDARGFDFAEGMVDKARENLEDAGHDPARVWRDNMEKPEYLEAGSFDCVMALGVLYYARDFDKSMDMAVKAVKPGGSMIFSLRNRLLSMFSLNKYSLDFFLEQLMPTSDLDDELGRQVTDYLSKRMDDSEVERKFKTIDDQHVHTFWHNPLTVEREVLQPRALKLKALYFYHYHALPPAFEHLAPERFRELSSKMENPTDWRGLFMTSAFVVHAIKT